MLYGLDGSAPKHESQQLFIFIKANLYLYVNVQMTIDNHNTVFIFLLKS